MDQEDTLQSPPEPGHSDQPMQCGACESALQSPGRKNISFLLLDQFTIPLVGCDNHLEDFCSICGLATGDSADLLNHRPAGGIHCPSCRNARHKSQQLIIPVGSGGLAILACATHQSDILTRFHTGLQVRHQLNASLDTFSSIP